MESETYETMQLVQGIVENGFAILRQAIDADTVSQLLVRCRDALNDTEDDVRARSSRGHVYAARNLLDAIPEVRTFWQRGILLNTLHGVLGERFGLVRALYFDKPPDRTWSLPWHKDLAIAVQDNTRPSSHFSRPTTKAGVPHVIASDKILSCMLTLRVHLDDVTDENGPLRVIPHSHQSRTCDGCGVDSVVTVHAAAGDVLAMRPLLSHSSGSSFPGTTHRRRVIHLEFSANPDLPDGYRWHDFLAIP